MSTRGNLNPGARNYAGPYLVEVQDADAVANDAEPEPHSFSDLRDAEDYANQAKREGFAVRLWHELPLAP